MDWTITEASPVPASLGYNGGSIDELRDNLLELRFKLGSVAVHTLITIKGNDLTLLINDKNGDVRRLLRTFDSGQTAEEVMESWFARAIDIEHAVVDALRGSKQSNSEKRLDEHKAKR